MLIRNLKTGLEFELPEVDALKVLESNKGKFVVVNGVTPVAEEDKPVEQTGTVKDLVKGEGAQFDTMNINELRKFAKDNEIDLKGCGNDKEKIVAREN